MVGFTEEAGIVPHFAREEAERRHQYYLGPEHLLLGLLVEDDNPTVREMREHGVNFEVVDNPAARVLQAHGAWPGPRAAGQGWSPIPTGRPPARLWTT
jgi:hypothetical protein